MFFTDFSGCHEVEADIVDEAPIGLDSMLPTKCYREEVETHALKTVSAYTCLSGGRVELFCFDIWTLSSNACGARCSRMSSSSFRHRRREIIVQGKFTVFLCRIGEL